jgi:hypothetical protein
MVVLVALGLLGICTNGALAAQGPRPEPAPPGGGSVLQPEPVPTQRAPAPPAAPTRSSEPPPAPVSRPSAPTQASVARFQPSVARTETPRPATARPASETSKKAKSGARAKARGPRVAKVTKRGVERAVRKVAGEASSPDRRLLLFGGLALLVLAVGEASFLTLSSRFLRRTAEP